MQHGARTPTHAGTRRDGTQLPHNRTNLRPEQRERGKRHHHKRRTATHIRGNTHRTGGQTRQRQRFDRIRTTIATGIGRVRVRRTHP